MSMENGCWNTVDKGNTVPQVKKLSSLWPNSGIFKIVRGLNG